MEVAVGIVSWNTAEHLDACLSALPAALGNLNTRVTVVDNASSDDSVAVAKVHDVEVIVNDTNRGYAAAMNQALAVASAPFLLALNPDTVAGPGTIADLVKVMTSHPNAGVVVPRLVNENGRHQASAYRFPGALAPVVAAISTPRLRRSGLGHRLLLEGGGAHRPGRVDWAIGAVHLIRTSALNGEAPYSERSFMYAEDLDLCWRLTQRGAPTVLADGVSIGHIGNVAGARAWGDTRSLRYWAATYDVIAQRRSRWFVLWAGLGGTLATLISIARTAPNALGRRGRASRQLLAIRTRELPVHARAAVLGPPDPPTAPPVDGGGGRRT